MGDNRTVERVQVERVKLDSASIIPFDIYLWAESFAATSLERNCGLPVNAKGQIIVDDQLRVKS